MDQVHSLINRLTRQVAANVHSAELLSTIEMLRQEIVKAGIPQLKQGQSVCVWMPNTLVASKPVATPISFAAAADVQPAIEEPVQIPVVEMPAKEIVKEEVAEPVEMKKEEPLVMPAVPRQVYSAPVPPPVVAAEVPSVKVAERQEFLLKSEPTEEERLEEAYMPKPSRPVPSPVESFPAPEINHAYIKVQELAAANHARISGNDVVKPFSKFAGVETAVQERLPVVPAPAPKKEINEMVIEEAIPLNQKLKTTQTELADILASPRIADLKKAFGINERFQFINSLFRGDGDMFDRSIRTLNNFGNYQEASFWMQRELIIKLGWNDEDELVQQFYKILSRRF